MIEYPKKLDNIFDKLQKNNIKPVIVGGYVRDNILNSLYQNQSLLTKDIDIELFNASSFEKIQEILAEFGNSNLIGKSFGVIKLKIDDIEIDFSMPRTENKISSGHNGFEVTTDSSLTFEQAASRRDFTINAIGYDVFNKKILDPFNGLEDIKNKKLKFVNKKTFVEDPLRVLRAMQFCARFELSVDEELLNVCSYMCKNEQLKELPKERIFEEFKKLFLKSDNPSIGLNFLKNVDQFTYFNEFDISEKDWIDTLKCIDNVDKTNLDNTANILVMLAIICYKMENKESFINKLTNKKNILKEINSLYHVENFLKHTDTLKYDLIKDIDLKILSTYLKAKSTNEAILKKINKIKPIVHGQDLINIGMKPSKDFTQILQLVYEIQIKKLFS